MPRREAGTSLPIARRAISLSVCVSFSVCGGAEGSRQKAWLVAPSKALRDVPQQPTGLLALNALASRYAGMSLPYGPTEQKHNFLCRATNCLEKLITPVKAFIAQKGTLPWMTPGS